MNLNFDLEQTASLLDEQSQHTSLLEKAMFRCNTKWYKVSWLGLLMYTTVACLNYLIGYYAIYRNLGWSAQEHSNVRIFGDLVTVGWFALGFVSLPWHQWEQLTCIKTKNCRGVCRFLAWWAGTLATFFVYGYMGQNPLFQTSLASDLTPSQRNVYVVVFGVVGLIVFYWLGKLCPCGNCKSLCNPPTERKVIFLRIIILVALLFVISYFVCSAENTCVYHLHHWWFGFVLVLISTATLDNTLDYFLQGIFWTFLIESLFNYGLTFGEFFI